MRPKNTKPYLLKFNDPFISWLDSYNKDRTLIIGHRVGQFRGTLPAGTMLGECVRCQLGTWLSRDIHDYYIKNYKSTLILCEHCLKTRHDEMVKLDPDGEIRKVETTYDKSTNTYTMSYYKDASYYKVLLKKLSINTLVHGRSKHIDEMFSLYVFDPAWVNDLE